MKTKLTVAKIAAAGVPPDKGEIKCWDAQVGGLYLRISSSGGRRWYFRYRNEAGKPSAIKLGDYPGVTIDAAREAAKVQAGTVAKGGDPAQLRQEKRRRERTTLGSLLDGYERSLCERGLVTVKDTMSRLRRGLTGLISADITTLSRLDFVAAFDALKGLPGAQAELRKNTRTFLEWTTNSGLTPHNVLAGYRKPQLTRSQIIAATAKRRELRDPDIIAVWNAAERSGTFGALVRLGLLSAMRRGELAGLRWSDIHADRIVLSAAVTKTATAHAVPLTPLMRGILDHQPRGTSELVFPSPVTGRAMRGWGELTEKLVRRADVGAWKLHDLRRTCRSLMSRCGVPEPAAELAIGHVKANLISIYNLDEQWAARVNAFSVVDDHIARLLAK